MSEVVVAGCLSFLIPVFTGLTPLVTQPKKLKTKAENAGNLRAASLLQFETALLILVRELGRLVMQATLQSLEPAPPLLPRDIYLDCGGYRRRSKQTANRYIATRFGTITTFVCFAEYEMHLCKLEAVQSKLGLTGKDLESLRKANKKISDLRLSIRDRLRELKGDAKRHALANDNWR